MKPANQIGEQQKVTFEAGDLRTQPLFFDRPECEGTLLRVVADGQNVVFTIVWGTLVNRQLVTVLPPFAADIAGACEVFAQLVDPEETGSANVTVVWASAKGPQTVRKFIDATGASQDAGVGAKWITNPGGAVVTYTAPDGTAISIPNDVNAIGRPWPIHSGSIISAGKAFVEYEI